MRSSRTLPRLLWLALLLAALVVATQLRVTTDMGAFLPRGGDAQEQLLLSQLGEKGGARILLLAIEAEQRAQAARLSQGLAAALRGQPRFARVLNGELQLAAAPEQPWYRYRFLLQDVEFSVDSLRAALQQRLQELRSPLGLYTRRQLADDPVGAFRRLLQGWHADNAPQRRHGVWFAADGRALLIVETRAAGFDLDAQQQNIAEVHARFAELPGSASARLRVSGAPAIAVASRETIRSEARQASLLAAAAVALLLLVAYRSWRLWLLSALPLAGGVVAALAVTVLLFGAVHGITIAFGVILLGVTIDYPIHLFSHLKPGEAPAVTLRRIWPTLRLGVLSTATGFSALLFTRFDGLMQLGVFAVSGLLAAALITRYLMTPLLPALWQGRSVGGSGPRRGGSGGMLVSLLVLSVSLALLATGMRPLWESDLAALSPVPEPLREQERTLREALAVPDLNHMLLVRGGDAEAVLQSEERLKPLLEQWVREGLIGGYTLASDRLPSVARQRERQRHLPDGVTLMQRLRLAGEGLPFRSTAFTPFVQAVEQSRSLPPLRFEQVQATALGLPLAGLLFERDGGWWGVVRLSQVRDAAALQTQLATLQEPVSHVDLKALTGRMLDGFREEALRNLLWGALAIMLMIGWHSGGLRRVWRVGLPLLAALALTLAVLHGLGERLTLFHLTALLLVAGLGIDYGLFFSRADAPQERGRTFHALQICATSSATVFAILALSRLPVLHAIGLTVFIGVAAAYWLARISAPGRSSMTNLNTQEHHG